MAGPLWHPVEVAVDLERSLLSFVSYSAEWTFAVAVTQTWQRPDDVEPGRPTLPLRPAANNQNQISLPSASTPRVLLVSRPHRSKVLRESGTSGYLLCSSRHALSNTHRLPRALQGVILSSGEVSQSNPITVRPAGIRACCDV